MVVWLIGAAAGALLAWGVIYDLRMRRRGVHVRSAVEMKHEMDKQGGNGPGPMPSGDVNL